METLKNGLRVVHIPLKEDSRFYLGATIASGSRYEPRTSAGISHLLEHMMFRGSKQYPTFKKLATAFEWLGGTWNAGTGHEHTEYWYSGSLQFGTEAIELFSEFFLNPNFQDFAVEKKIIYREIEGELNELGHSTDMDHQMQKLFWPSAKLSSPIMGSESSVSAITLSQLKDFRRRCYAPERIVVCAVGGTTADDIMPAIKQCFEKMKPAQGRKMVQSDRVTAKTGPLAKLIPHADNEYQVQLSFRCEGEWSSKSMQYELITRILADGFCSRLGARIREQLGMVYDIDAELSLFSDVGTIDISASIELEMVPKFVKEVCIILNSLKEKGCKKDELVRTKRRSVVDLGLLPDDPESIAFKLSWSILSGRNTKLKYSAQKLEKVTGEDLQKTCQQIFKPSRAGLLLLGPKNNDIRDECLNVIKKYL